MCLKKHLHSLLAIALMSLASGCGKKSESTGLDPNTESERRAEAASRRSHSAKERGVEDDAQVANRIRVHGQNHPAQAQRAKVILPSLRI